MQAVSKLWQGCLGTAAVHLGTAFQIEGSCACSCVCQSAQPKAAAPTNSCSLVYGQLRQCCKCWCLETKGLDRWKQECRQQSVLGPQNGCSSVLSRQKSRRCRCSADAGQWHASQVRKFEGRAPYLGGYIHSLAAQQVDKGHSAQLLRCCRRQLAAGCKSESVSALHQQALSASSTGADRMSAACTSGAVQYM